MVKFSESTLLTPKSWKTTIAEEIINTVSSDSMQSIYRQLQFTPRGPNTSYFTLISQIIDSCFFIVFFPLFRLIAYLISYYAFIEEVLAAIRTGLFMDFILFSIDYIWNMQCGFVQMEINDGLPLYRNLQHAVEKRCILYDHIQLPERHRKKRGELNTIKFLKAYERQLKYFYGDESNLILPEFRRKNTTDITKYSFSVMGKLFDSHATEAETWINFYLREKYWGTNLAALISSYDPRVRDYAPKEFWEVLTEKSSREATVVDSLIRFPFPACRMTYVQTAIKNYVSPNVKFFIPGFKDFLKVQYMFSSISDYATPSCILNNIEDMQKQALYLLIGTHVQFINYGLERNIKSPTRDQIILWLSAPENLNAIQGNLCKLASSEFGKLRDRPCSSINDLNSQWPLLLLFQNTDHIETLFSTKMSPTRGRNTSDQAFTTAQARCYGIIK